MIFHNKFMPIHDGLKSLPQLQQVYSQLQQSPQLLQQPSHLQNQKHSLLKPAPLMQSLMRIAAVILDNRFNAAPVCRSQFLSTNANAVNALYCRMTFGSHAQTRTFNVCPSYST
jgi:hypothetical protein